MPGATLLSFLLGANGHSLYALCIDCPRGEVVATTEEKEGIVYADIGMSFTVS